MNILFQSQSVFLFKENKQTKKLVTITTLNIYLYLISLTLASKTTKKSMKINEIIN